MPPTLRVWKSTSMAGSGKSELVGRLPSQSPIFSPIRRIRRSLSRKVRHLWSHAGTNCGRLARVIDDVVDCAVIAQRYRDHVVKPYPRTLRRLDRPGQHDIRINEDAVHAQSPRLVTGYSIRHLV